MKKKFYITTPIYYVNDEPHISVVYEDWTRIGSFLNTSEVVEEGYIIM